VPPHDEDDMPIMLIVEAVAVRDVRSRLKLVSG